MRTSRVGRKGSRRGKRMAEIRGSRKKCKQALKERERETLKEGRDISEMKGRGKVWELR